MGAPRSRHYPVRAKEEDKLSQKVLVFSELDGIKRFEGELIRALVIEARLPHGGDDYPIAPKIDGVTIPLVNRGHPPASIWPVERVLWSLSLESNDELSTIRPKPPNRRVGKIPINFDKLLQRDSVVSRIISRARITEYAHKEVLDKDGKKLSLLERVGTRARKKLRPLIE